MTVQTRIDHPSVLEKVSLFLPGGRERVSWGMWYEVINTLSSCGNIAKSILKGTDIFTNQVFAVKRRKNRHPHQTLLRRECQVYEILNGNKNFPRVHWYIELPEYHLMAMDFLGPSVDDLLHRRGRSLDAALISWVGGKVLEQLEHLHAQSLIHCHIKPRSLLFSVRDGQQQIYMVNFALARYYRDPATRQHYAFQSTNELVGSPSFASILAHYGYPCSRRDDLESLGYVLVYLCRGSLPWQSRSRKTPQDIVVEKLKITSRELCQGLPIGILEFVEYVRDLGFDTEPDYGWLRQRLCKIAET
ncbi:hypothetical protein FE257_002317 [Aspergillus nanangensis]|uniref:Protein kinase domain-containing protein n=1 Tax=Aspergillus nanangensis TaxID=2582783 RepID=A0AAD4CE59_ASPNN|nr:hypothetical protein FE257_002317 [Aspergillus nanangensis]